MIQKREIKLFGDSYAATPIPTTYPAKSQRFLMIHHEVGGSGELPPLDVRLSLRKMLIDLQRKRGILLTKPAHVTYAHATHATHMPWL